MVGVYLMESIKKRVGRWISDKMQRKFIVSQELSVKSVYFYFKIEGFCDEPEIFLVATSKGLEWGYDTAYWEEPSIPVPIKRITHILTWEILNELEVVDKENKIVETIIKAINYKKKRIQ